jgi:multiple sugar transport system ATP-binding protein
VAEIAFRNVSKRYGKTVALSDVSFTVEDNEFFCFFGPPLSGKSTILRLILGLETPDSGEIVIGGRPANGVSPADRNVSMVFQNLALFPHMTALENVRFPLAERKVPEAEIARKLDDVSEKLHIRHILHKPPGQLSGGERQRIAIARALVRDPVAYLMDDPISALDARLREETRVELKRIQRELGKTLIYVTHDQEEAMSVADRIAIMEQGSIRQIGTPREIYDHPASTYVARLLGSPMMNILPSTLEDGVTGPAGGTIAIPGLTGGDTAEIGLRPEDIKVAAWAEGDGGRPSRVFQVEPLGGYTVITVDAGSSRVRALVRGQPDIRPETLVALSCDAARVHRFGPNGAAMPQ